MYCCKCGKEIPAGNLCAQCAAMENLYHPPVKPQPIYTNPADKMLGFGKALTATIMGVIGFIVSYIGFFLVIWQNIGNTDSGTACIVISIPLAIIALILGISSIKVFSSRKNLRPKPVATLVLGIVGVASSALTTIFIIFGALISTLMESARYYY